MSKDKKLKTKWLKILQILFIIDSIKSAFEIIEGILYLILNSVSTGIYSSGYDYGGGKDFLIMCSLIVGSIRLVMMIRAVIHWEDEAGYQLIINSIYMHGIFIVLYGYFKGVSGILAAVPLGAAWVIPNIIYIKKRVYLFYPETDSFLENKKERTVTLYACSDCGNSGFEGIVCPLCNSRHIHICLPAENTDACNTQEHTGETATQE